VIDEVLSIYAGTRGHLDKIPRDQVAVWEKEFIAFMHEQKSEIVKKLTETKKLEDDTAASIESAIAEFQTQYARKQSTATAKA